VALEPLESLSPLILIIFSVGGLVLGSFASAMIHRIPLGEGVFGSAERSACPQCKTTLGVRDLVPLFSWLFSKGKCNHCRKPIPVFYPLIELSSCVLALVILFMYEAEHLAEQVLVLLSLPFLLALVVIDFRHKILPNRLLLVLFSIGAIRLGLVLWLEQEEAMALLVEFIGGAFIYGLISLSMAFLMEKILKKKALGMGDVKFFAVAGLWLGLSSLGVFCILSGILGVLLGLAWKHIHKEPAFPFGPALILSFFTLLLLNSSHLL